MKTYIGKNSGIGPQKVLVTDLTRRQGIDKGIIDRYELKLGPSYKLYPHTADGFQWGCPGRGPSQLALAILLDLTKDPDLSVRLHQEFKEDMVATAGINLLLIEPDIKKWLEDKRKQPA